MYSDIFKVIFEFLHPPVEPLEGGAISKIEDDHGTQRVLIEGFVECPKALLTSCIPNLQDHDFVIDGNMFFWKLQSYSGIGPNSKFVLDIAWNHIAFAYSALS